MLLVVAEPGSAVAVPDWIGRLSDQYDRVFYCDVRGVGETRWTRKNPPNYVERSHVLLGTTVDAGRVWDVAASSRYLANQHSDVQIHVAGEGGAGIVGAYAALWEPGIAALHLTKPPLTHMDSAAPPFLNVLRVCDIPEVLGMLAPRPLQIRGAASTAIDKIKTIYRAAASSASLRID